ncbi:hypothetical protein Q9966_015325, partial [Columba livia]
AGEGKRPVRPEVADRAGSDRIGSDRIGSGRVGSGENGAQAPKCQRNGVFVVIEESLPSQEENLSPGAVEPCLSSSLHLLQLFNSLHLFNC